MRVNKRKFIVEFLKRKSEKISFGDVIYMTSEDLEEIENETIFPLDVIDEVFNNISSLDDFSIIVWPGKICPWCIKMAGAFEECIDYDKNPCTYSKRHGNCQYNSLSTYLQIKRHANEDNSKVVNGSREIVIQMKKESKYGI